jgi:hypothetical protein
MEDLAKHMMLTDHYFPLETLERIGAALKRGETVNFEPADVQGIVADLQRLQPDLAKMQWELRGQMPPPASREDSSG